MSSSGRWSQALIVGLALLTAASCRTSHNLGKAEGQAAFGVQMAKANLWREAMFRFKRAIELAPNDAGAYNNLAVAYEANGDFEGAAKAYREAMRLDKSNQYIQKNYSRLVEFTSKNKKRGAKPAAATLAPAAAKAPSDAAAPAAPDAPPTPPVTHEPPATPVAPPPNPAPSPLPESGSPASPTSGGAV